MKIYISTYNSFYKTIKEIKAKDIQNVLEPIQFNVVDLQEDINYPIENHKDAIGLPELFNTISKEDAISFINYISQYLYLASNHEVGKKIFNELSELTKNSLEEIEDMFLFRRRLWKEK